MIEFDPQNLSCKSEGKVDICFCGQQTNNFLYFVLTIFRFLNNVYFDISIYIPCNFPFGTTETTVCMGNEHFLSNFEFFFQIGEFMNGSGRHIVLLLRSNTSWNNCEVFIRFICKKSSEFAINGPGKSFCLSYEKESICVREINETIESLIDGMTHGYLFFHQHKQFF